MQQKREKSFYDFQCFVRPQHINASRKFVNKFYKKLILRACHMTNSEKEFFKGFIQKILDPHKQFLYYPVLVEFSLLNPKSFSL